MNALQQIYDLEIENNKFLAAINQKLDELKKAGEVELQTDNQQSEQVAEQ